MGIFDSFRAERAKLLAAPDSAPSAYHRQRAELVRVPPEPVLLPQFCSVYGLLGLIVAQRHGNQLKLIRSEKIPSGFDGGSAPPPVELGAFQLDGSNWSGCAHCGAINAPAYNLTKFVWWCLCSRCDGKFPLFHCTGNRNGQFRTVCGMLTKIEFFTPLGYAPVHGWRSSAAVQQAAPIRREPPLSPAPLSLGLTPVPPRITAPPSSTPRIGLRGRHS